MAYGDSTLNADHRWSFNNVLTDSIGSMTISNSGGSLVATPITRDATHSYQTNGRDDLATVTPTADTGGSGFSQYAFQGWFRVSQIQGPPVMIYGQGGGTAGFALFMWAGNNIMLQVTNDAGNTKIQIFSDIALTDNRSYHFFVRWSGNGFNNEAEFYLDGVKQTSNKDGVAPNVASMTAHSSPHTWGENGTGSVTIPVGTLNVLVKAPVNGFWAEWWTWEGSDADAITESQILNDLFGAGAIPDLTISTDTEANMQIALDAIADTVRGDVPLAILIEDVSGGGDLELIADNVTFNSRCSLHIQWEGAGTLTWINENGSNATSDKASVTGGGTVNIVEAVPVTVTVTDIDTGSAIQDAVVYLEESPGGTPILNAVNTNASGVATTNYQFSSNQAVVGRVRKGSSGQLYKTSILSGTITASGLSLNVVMVKDS